MKAAYVSISNLLWDEMPNKEFEQLKTGFAGEVHGTKYEITQGIPKEAKLISVCYLFEHPDLPEIEKPFDHPSIAILMKNG